MIVNSAAYTKVDACEGEGREQAFAVNGEAVAHIAAAAERIGARLLHVSTDYVFDGRADSALRRGRADAPLSVYGQSKLARASKLALASPNALVVRTSWLFGPGGPNFVATMARLIDRREAAAPGGGRPGGLPDLHTVPGAGAARSRAARRSPASCTTATGSR